MYNLTKPQKLIYDMEKFSGGAISVICGSVLRKGHQDLSELNLAVNMLYRINDALRTRIVESDGETMQAVSDFVEQNIETLHFANKTELEAYATEYAKQPLDFYGNLCEIKIVVLPDQYGALIKLHHIIGDAWSLSLLASQFCAILDGETPWAYPYADYAAAETEYLQSERYEKDRAYFLEQFKKCEEVTYLSEKQNDSLAAARKTFVIGAEQSRRISAYAEAHHTSPFMLFMTALAAYMNRTKMNAERFYIGTAVLNRTGVREKNTVGMFINTVPMLIELSNEQTFAENLASIAESAFSVFRHQKYNYGDVLTDIRKEYGFTERLYDVMLSYQNAKVSGDAESAWYHSGVQTESLQIHIDDRDGEGILKIQYDYQTGKFTEREIDRLHQHICNLLFDAIANDSKKLYELDLLTADERQKLLFDFNDTAVDYPREKCVHTLFEEQAARTPEKTAVIARDRTLTYAELNEQANRIAHGLIEKGVGVGEIVAFALPRTSNLITTILGILKAGAAYLPVDPDYPRERIDFMLSDSNTKLFITESVLTELLKNQDTTNPMVSMSSENLCYCIYTSGSTGTPKGVLLRHQGIVNLVTNLDIYHDLSQCERIGFMTTITFDVASQEIFTALMNGFTGALMPERRETTPDEIINDITKNKVDVIYATPTYFDALTDTDERADALLNSVKVVALAGEKFSLNTHVLKSRNFENVIFENQYGPVELHVIATATTLQDNDFDSIGKPIGNDRAYIVDKYLRPTPIGVTGELCVAGDGVGAGYLNRPELTAEKFIDNPFGTGKLYKTGDLACWREDGNIVYVGRNDFQVKIRGLRIELGEIENAISAIDGISQAVVVVRKDAEGRQLICAFYTGVELPAKEIRGIIGQKLPKYMLPHIFTHLDELPLTPSGKVNRNALPEVDLSQFADTSEYVAPEGEAEALLAALMEQVLNYSPIGRDDNFFDLGGDSLKAIELISALESAGYHTDVRTLFTNANVRDLAAKLTPAEQRAIPVEVIGDVPATPAQMRVYTAQAMQGDTSYNVPFAFRVESVVPEKLQNAVQALVDRHEAFRTHFEDRDGQIMQIVEPEVSIEIECLDSEDITAFVRPFDLSRAPLLRVGYCGNTVMVDMHHIITDGSSMPVFFRELNELYMGRELNRPTVQYRQFAAQPQDYSESEAYWLSVFSDELPVLEMNTDFKQEQKRSYSGDAIYTTFDSALHQKIVAASRKLSVTPYAFYIGGFYILLSKFSGNEDIIVGIPVSGREGAFLDTMGMFVNTVTLRNQPVGTKTVREFLSEIREKSVAAIAHQEYPYNNLVKKLGLSSTDRNPLFDVMFAYQDEAMMDVVFGDKPTELLPIPVTTAKYDFSFNVMPRKDDVVVMAEYCTDLYRESTIQRFIDGYSLILEQMLNADSLLKDISAITEQERQKLLFDFNNTAVDYPRDKCVHTLFEEQAARTPDKTAVIACDRTLTYAELNEQANRIAHGLINRGVGVGDIVAFALPRKSHLISTILGIFKAGAVCLPIDPDYPQNRIDYMLTDSRAKLLISEHNIEEFLQSDGVGNPAASMSSEALCYCIYTSGSTGEPKGATLTHRNIVDHFSDNIYIDAAEKCSAILCLANIIFDMSINEIFTALLRGKQCVLASETEMTSADALAQTIRKNAVDLIICTPSKFSMYLYSEEFRKAISGVKVLTFGGEAFTYDLYNSIRASTTANIFNGYGPTETTIVVTYGEITGEDISIGKPLANTQLYIVDKYMKPMPIGATGELCVAGDLVGAGYLNRPELTAEKFIDNPFGAGKCYKTGDLAYWREDGNIVYVGRNDFQVKIRGLRIELGEIENAISAINGISQAVVIVRKDAEGRQLICAFYTGVELPAKEIRGIIGQKLPKYMLPHIFTHLDELPLTPSGKVNRKALPEVDLSQFASTSEYVAPEGEAETRLAALMEQVLNYSPIGRDDNFFDLGGDSLKAIELISALESAGYHTDVRTLFANATVRDFAAKLTLAEQRAIPVEVIGDVPATPAQMRVYTAQAMQGGTAYNVPFAFRAESVVPDRLQNAVQALVNRHEAFRTYFKDKDGQIMQVVEPEVSIEIERLDSDDISAFVRPFDLSKAPLLRVGYYGNTVMVDMHHIITDGGSMPVLFRELNELYMGRELKRPAVQYRQFAAQPQDYSESEAYWLSVFSDELPVLELNTDFKREQKRSYNGDAIYTIFDSTLHKKIVAASRKLGVTPFVFYIGAFYILLSKFSGNEDIVVGIPVSGREGRFLNTIGMFVNTVALRNRPIGTKTVEEFLSEVWENSVAAIAHQEYLFNNLVKKLGLNSTDRNPLFDVMFAYQDDAMTDVVFGDHAAEILPVPVMTAKYDFTFNILPKNENVVVMVEYCTDLYRPSTIKRLVEGYKLVFDQMLNIENII